MTDPARAPGAGPFWTGALEYALPPELIAQEPAAERTESRLLVLDRASGGLAHRRFADLVTFLRPGDLLVANDSAVFQARLAARKPSGGAVEILLLASGSVRADGAVPAMVRASKPVRAGQLVELSDGTGCRVVEAVGAGRFLVAFEPAAAGRGSTSESAASVAERLGSVPLPPYIERPDGPLPEDRLRYQTVYARRAGSVAAPTAGLHFSPELIAAAAAAGVSMAFVTLHVGPGTFTPVRGPVERHRMETEWCTVGDETARRINDTRSAGGRVVAVGTTTVRALESAAARLASARAPLAAWHGETDLFIRPGHEFRVVDGLITNFHLPASTLLCLVMALAGESLLRDAYEEAVRRRYRFYSYGDAMLVL